MLSPKAILMTLYLIGGISVGVLVFLSVGRASEAEHHLGRSMEVADLRTRLLDLALETQRLDALAMRDVLSEETLYGDPDETEIALREQLEAYSLRVEEMEGIAELVAELRAEVDALITSARTQLALKATEPREIDQHDEVARQSRVYQERLVMRVRAHDDSLTAVQMRASASSARAGSAAFWLLVGGIGVAAVLSLAAFGAGRYVER